MARKSSKSRQIEVEENHEEVSESYISIGLGLLVVVVIGILLYNYFTQKNANKTEADKQADRLAQESTMSAKPGSTYTVAAGDTLWSISEKSYGTGYSWGKIAEANNLQNSDQLEAGQQLVIPIVPSAIPEVPAPDASALEVSPVASPISATTNEPSPSPVSETPQPVPNIQPVTITGSTYIVVTGDTLWNIACRAYGDCYAWVRIAEANKLVNPNLIHPGNEFVLPR